MTLATVNPNRVEDPRELVDIDLGVVSGAFGVAENGAVWIPQDIRHKALYFGATALMVVIPREALVDTSTSRRAPRSRGLRLRVFHVGPFEDCRHRTGAGVRRPRPMSVTVVLR